MFSLPFYYRKILRHRNLAAHYFGALIPGAISLPCPSLAVSPSRTNLSCLRRRRSLFNFFSTTFPMCSKQPLADSVVPVNTFHRSQKPYFATFQLFDTAFLNVQVSDPKRSAI